MIFPVFSPCAWGSGREHKCFCLIQLCLHFQNHPPTVKWCPHNSQMVPSQQSNGASLLGPRVLGFRFNQSLSYRKGKFSSLKTETLMIQCLFVWICSYISFESHSNEEQMLRIVNNRIWLLTFFKMIFNCFCYSISWKGELIARSFRSKTARKFVRKMLAQ